MTGQDADLVRTLHEAAIAGAIPVVRLPHTPRGDPLAREWATYYQELDRLLADGHQGRFALVRGDHIAGIYDALEDAASAGREHFGAESYLAMVIQPAIGRHSWGTNRVCPG